MLKRVNSNLAEDINAEDDEESLNFLQEIPNNNKGEELTNWVTVVSKSLEKARKTAKNKFNEYLKSINFPRNFDDLIESDLTFDLFGKFPSFLMNCGLDRSSCNTTVTHVNQQILEGVSTSNFFKGDRDHSKDLQRIAREHARQNNEIAYMRSKVEEMDRHIAALHRLFLSKGLILDRDGFNPFPAQDLILPAERLGPSPIVLESAGVNANDLILRGELNPSTPVASCRSLNSAATVVTASTMTPSILDNGRKMLMALAKPKDPPALLQLNGFKNVTLNRVFFSWYDEEIHAVNGSDYFPVPKSYTVNEHIKKFARIVFYMKLFLPATRIPVKPVGDCTEWKEHIRVLASRAADDVFQFRVNLECTSRATTKKPKHTQNVLAMQKFLSHVDYSSFPRLNCCHIQDDAISLKYLYLDFGDLAPCPEVACYSVDAPQNRRVRPRAAKEDEHV